MKKVFNYDIYGNLRHEFDYGFSVDGDHFVSPDDDTVTRFDYKPNLSKYIVGKVVRKIVVEGSTFLWDLDKRLLDHRNIYDANTTTYAEPTVGNMTKSLMWNGDMSNQYAFRTLERHEYGLRGNEIKSYDARGNATEYAYETAKNLFQIEMTNAYGQSVQKVTWNSTCQMPDTMTDLNDVVTVFQYDALCRETQRQGALSSRTRTSYLDFGNPNSQGIKTEVLAGTSDATYRNMNTWQYFDGFGQTYRTQRTDKVSATEQSIVQLTGFDARGNVAWSGLPFRYGAEPLTKPAPDKATWMTYDPLGRNLTTVLADGAKTETSYGHWANASYHNGVSAPNVQVKGPSCFDDNAAAICHFTHTYFDAYGRLTRVHQYDEHGTDVGQNAGWRRQEYRTYDLLGRLLTLTDGQGATYTYTYDIFGNRIKSEDPGLGVWNMTYDDNHNLLSQVDSNGQRIEFTYDKLNRQTRKRVYHADNSLESEITSVYGEVRDPWFNKGRLTTAYISAGDGKDLKVEYDYDPEGTLKREFYTIDGRKYHTQSTIRRGGVIARRYLPSQPGQAGSTWQTEYYTIDASNRVIAIPGMITSVDYDVWGHPSKTTFANGVTDTITGNAKRGYIDKIAWIHSDGTQIDHATYTRYASGKVARINGRYSGFAWDYTYDYAGRLLSADSYRHATKATRTFTYDSAGRMHSNSEVGDYIYTSARPFHAPANVDGAPLTYDANGNMTKGLNGKIMTYDAENRPTSVTYGGNRTEYVYGPDGTRWKKIEKAGTTDTTTTVYFGGVEVRNFKELRSDGHSAEEILHYIHPSIQAVYKLNSAGVAYRTISYMHRDQLGSVRLITGPDGNQASRKQYYPFGSELESVTDADSTLETKGFIGERFDDDSGLQYLNARYYDPQLGLFIQPDWFDPTMAGVGPNRYSYSFNDPINRLDPNGNLTYDVDEEEFRADEGDTASSIAESLGLETADLVGANGELWGAEDGGAIASGSIVSVPENARISTGMAAAAMNGDERFSEAGRYNAYYSGKFGWPLGGTYKCNLFVGLAIEQGFGQAPMHDAEAGAYALADKWLNASEAGMQSIPAGHAAFGDIASWPSSAASGHTSVYMSNVRVRSNGVVSGPATSSGWGMMNASSEVGAIYRNGASLNERGYAPPAFTRFSR